MAEPLRQFFEVYPADTRATRPLGLRVNDVVYANGLAGVDPVTGVPVNGIEAQMWQILAHLRQIMESAGGSLDGVVRCAAYVTNMEDRETIYGPWENLFPDAADRPGLKALITPLPEGHLVHLDAFGMIGGKRTRIDIPNVHARDPAVRVGNVFFTSRCHGNDQTTGEIVEGGVEAEARQTLENLATLVGLAGGSEADIVQLNMFGRDDSYKEVARRMFEERFPDPATRPALHQMVNVVSSRMNVAIEMMALLPENDGPSGERFVELYSCEEGNAKPSGARIGDVGRRAAAGARRPVLGRAGRRGLRRAARRDVRPSGALPARQRAGAGRHGPPHPLPAGAFGAAEVQPALGGVVPGPRRPSAAQVRAQPPPGGRADGRERDRDGGRGEAEVPGSAGRRAQRPDVDGGADRQLGHIVSGGDGQPRRRPRRADGDGLRERGRHVPRRGAAASRTSRR